MLIFKCPKCEDSLMGFNEADNSWVCTAGDCQHEVTAEEADALFEAGELLGVVDSNFEDVSEEEDADDDDDDDEDELEEGGVANFGDKKAPPFDKDDAEQARKKKEEEDDEEEKAEESFHGFSNADTWALNLLVQNEYKVYKGAANVIADSENSEKALKSFVTKSVLKNKDYADVLEMIDPKKVVWGEIVTSVNEAAKEFADIRADLEKALSQNEDLNESERKNVALVFESALAVKYNDMKAKLEEKFQVDLDKKVQETATKMTEEMSGYLDEVVQEWMDENKLAIQHGIQLEKNHLFMDGLRDLFEKHYIDVPEERFDILEDMSDKIEQMDEQLSDAKAREAELQEKLDEANKQIIVNKLSEDLTDTQVEKLADLAGSIDYESAEAFEENLKTLKESFLTNIKPRKEGDVVIVEEQNDVITEDHDDKVKVDRNDPISLAARGLRRKA